MLWFWLGVSALTLSVSSLTQQAPIHPSVHTVANVIKGSDNWALFRNSLSKLLFALPEDWERLINPPETTGTSGIDIIVFPEHLQQAVNGWGLDKGFLSQAIDDVELLVEVHAQKSAYVSQTFKYNIPGCRGDLSTCMFSLIVVARRIIQANLPEAVEIRHLYMEAFSSISETCHPCWLNRCCHHRNPSNLTSEELGNIQLVMSTHLAWWGYDNIPNGIIDIIDEASYRLGA
ncbi:hypothetical protein BGZ68_002117 [Mortierella alpina]|nr:hypothetical protein BGZ68_002117 [Mortierella alpina]